MLRALAKSLIHYPTEPRWRIYTQQKFLEYFTNREAPYDKFIELISDFHRNYGFLPQYDALCMELLASGERSVQLYVDEILADPQTPTYEGDSAFAAACDVAMTQYLNWDVQTAMRAYNAAASTGAGALNRDALTKAVDDLGANLRQAKQKVIKSEGPYSALLYGEKAVREFRQEYEDILERKRANANLYYKLPYKAFEKVKIYRGDNVVIAGCTSQGKSLILRDLLYHLVVQYGLNSALWNLEVPSHQVKMLLAIRHANNKEIFPGTPMIPTEAWEEGILGPEDRDFLEAAAQDLFNNPSYGTLLLEDTPAYGLTMGELQERIREIEDNVMPLHVVAVDYITRMTPGVKGAKWQKDDRQAYNQLFADFRITGLTHRNREGEPSPFLGLTGAQISRGKFTEAVENEGIYDITCVSDYSESERSATHLISTYMTPEYREKNQLRLQVLKNRKGAVPLLPVDLSVALPWGMGISNIDPIAEDGRQDVVQILGGF